MNSRWPFRSVFAICVVLLVTLGSAGVMAKGHHPSPDPGGNWFFSGQVLDWNLKPIPSRIYIEYYTFSGGGLLGERPVNMMDSYDTGPDAGFTLFPSAPPLQYDSTTMFRLVVLPLVPGYQYWAEERILYLPQPGRLSFYLPITQHVQVPMMVQYANCDLSGITVPQYTHSYSITPIYNPNPDAPKGGWQRTLNIGTSPGGGRYTGFSQSTSGLPMFVMADYKFTGVYFSRHWDGTSNKFVYGRYWNDEVGIVQGNLLGLNDVPITRGGLPFWYASQSGNLGDYATPSNSLPGQIKKTLSANEVWPNSFVASGSVALTGPCAVVGYLHIGGGFSQGTSVDVYSTIPCVLAVSGTYTVSYAVTCPSDGPHTYMVWVDHFICHIWKLS